MAADLAPPNAVRDFGGGYYLRAAQRLRDLRGTVLIGTGFPVGDTFETVMSRGETSLACTVEVVRKERSRRQGLALRVVEMSKEAEKTFEAMRL